MSSTGKLVTAQFVSEKKKTGHNVIKLFVSVTYIQVK
jgi:hypothetical protein